MQLSAASFLLKKNLISNYAGTIWVTLVQLAVIPAYVRYLGVESYGVIGVYATLTMLAGLLDLGLSPAINRELSRLSAQPGKGDEMRTLVRTLESLYWPLILCLVAVILPFIPRLATHWLHPSSLSIPDVERALRLMLLQVGAQMLLGFYAGGLIGLQRHVLMNGINVAAITLRVVGAIGVLKWIAPTLHAFFLWQIAITVVHTLLMTIAVWRTLPSGRATFDLKSLRATWRYATGVLGIVALSLLLTQMDKIILSHILTLANYGLYALASTVAMTLGKPVGPLFTTLLPRMTQLASGQDQAALARLYHRGSQLASVLVLPAATTLILFAPEAMLLWTRDASTTAAMVPLVILLTLGYACNSLMYLPYALTLAFGWVRFALYQNALACLVMLPLTLWLAVRYGALGGALSWAVLNVSYVLFSLYFLHRRLLPSEYRAWYLQDTLPALLAAGGTGLMVRYWAPDRLSGWPAIVLLAGTYLFVLLATALTLTHVRTSLFSLVHRISNGIFKQ